MARRSRKNRSTTTPSKIEVNIRAIPLLPPTGWKLYDLTNLSIGGTAPKDYLAYGEPSLPTTCGYIAKKGRFENDARECVTEEIISKIGAMLPVKMARSKLVRISKQDVRFLSRNFVEWGKFELLHGIELAAQYFESNQSEVESVFELSDRKSEHEFYTVPNILLILDSLYPNDKQMLEESFFRVLAFDSFIGAHDRHAMNWGILSPVDENLVPIRFSPIFDTARGLFWDFSDEDMAYQVKHQGRKGFLERYAEKSRPIISSGRGEEDNHFSLMKWISTEFPDTHKGTICRVFNEVRMSAIERMLQRKFRRIITQYRIGFIMDLLALRIDRLQQEVQT